MEDTKKHRGEFHVCARLKIERTTKMNKKARKKLHKEIKRRRWRERRKKDRQKLF
jgi:hypothetical protein